MIALPASPPATGYHADLEAEVDLIARSGRCRIVEYGTSVEGRPLRGIEIGSGPGGGNDRPLAMVVANMHGNEVISSELALVLADEAAHRSPNAAAVTDRADVLIAPCLNPDGRARAFASLDRRKLWNSCPRRNAAGVDLNRNWPWPDDVVDHWLPISGTRNRRLPWYRGPRPLSEPETAAVAALVEGRPPQVLLNLHSTGRILTHPWSSKPEPPADQAGFEAMIAAFRGAQTAWRHRASQGRDWYPNIGSSNDWFYDRFATLAMTVELARNAAAVRDDLRRCRWLFWWANPSDPHAITRHDAAACWAALAAGLEHRAGAPSGTEAAG